MEELQTFKDQLALVKLQLEADPGNEDLLSLKAEFEELIMLTEQAAAASAPKADKGKAREKENASASGSATAPAANSHWQESGEYKAGMDCMAKYKDGKW
jgi:survival-of-motor-neuron-related-splicing factor 30